MLHFQLFKSRKNSSVFVANVVGVVVTKVLLIICLSSMTGPSLSMEVASFNNLVETWDSRFFLDAYKHHGAVDGGICSGESS